MYLLLRPVNTCLLPRVIVYWKHRISHENKHTVSGRRNVQIFTSRHRHLAQQLGKSAIYSRASCPHWLHGALTTKHKMVTLGKSNYIYFRVYKKTENVRFLLDFQKRKVGACAYVRF